MNRTRLSAAAGRMKYDAEGTGAASPRADGATEGTAPELRVLLLSRRGRPLASELRPVHVLPVRAAAAGPPEEKLPARDGGLLRVLPDDGPFAASPS